MVRVRLTEEIFPPGVGTVSGSLKLMRESTFLSRVTPSLIQEISGGGIPVAEQVKVTESFSLTVYTRPSGGKVMLNMTTEEENNGLRSSSFLLHKVREETCLMVSGSQ